MAITSFPLGSSNNNKLIKLISIIFGIVCIGIAVFWTAFNIKSIRSDATLWITIIFLGGFGLYQVLSGLGKTSRFIEIGTDYIRLKKNAILSPVILKASDIAKVEFFPLNVVFFLKSGKRVLLRFGTTFNDINEKIVEGLFIFTESNMIPFEEVQEKL